jgi:ADP-heptose:LPS heptosyltransferase
MKKILFITATRLGDAILSTGILNALVQQYPDAAVTVVCGPVPAPIFRAMPNLAKLIVLKKDRLSRHWLRMWQQAVGTRWDLIVDLRRSFAARLLLGRRVEIPHGCVGEHKVEQYARALKLLPPPSPHIWLDSAAHAAARAVLTIDKKYFAVGPTANWAGKTWPVERFISVIRTLTSLGGIFENYTPVIFGAPGEEDQAAPIFQTFGDSVVNLVGKLDPLATAAAIKQCKFFIGNDSGLMHLSAALGVPTLGLFGPSHPEVYGPWGQYAAYVRTEKTFAELTGTVGYNHRTTGTLMESLPVQKVLTAAETLWQTVQQQARAA